MTVQTAAEFLVKVGEDNNLAAQIKDINTAEELISFAQTQGYEFTQGDVEQLEESMESDELSEDQLEAVAGGGWFSDTVDFIYENRKPIGDALKYVKDKWF